MTTYPETVEVIDDRIIPAAPEYGPDIGHQHVERHSTASDCHLCSLLCGDSDYTGVDGISSAQEDDCGKKSTSSKFEQLTQYDSNSTASTVVPSNSGIMALIAEFPLLGCHDVCFSRVNTTQKDNKDNFGTPRVISAAIHRLKCAEIEATNIVREAMRRQVEKRMIAMREAQEEIEIFKKQTQRDFDAVKDSNGMDIDNVLSRRNYGEANANIYQCDDHIGNAVSFVCDAVFSVDILAPEEAVKKFGPIGQLYQVQKARSPLHQVGSIMFDRQDVIIPTPEGPIVMHTNFTQNTVSITKHGSFWLRHQSSMRTPDLTAVETERFERVSTKGIGVDSFVMELSPRDIRDHNYRKDDGEGASEIAAFDLKNNVGNCICEKSVCNDVGHPNHQYTDGKTAGATDNVSKSIFFEDSDQTDTRQPAVCRNGVYTHQGNLTTDTDKKEYDTIPSKTKQGRFSGFLQKLTSRSSSKKKLSPCN